MPNRGWGVTVARPRLKVGGWESFKERRLCKVQLVKCWNQYQNQRRPVRKGIQGREKTWHRMRLKG